MPLSKAQYEEKKARRQSAIEASNRNRWALVSRGRWFGLYNTQFGDVELISEDRGTAKRALAARLRADPNWRDT
jgi:hypothetical protein